MADKTAYERQQALAERNDKRGLCSPRVWIPKDKREELLALAAQWRAEHKLQGGK